MTNDEKLYLSTILEEYKSLRDESKQININMFLSFQIGTLFIGVTLSAAFNQWEKLAVSGVILIVILPLASLMFMHIWLGEAVRLKRVGDYLAFVEQKIGILFSVNCGISKLIYEEIHIIQKESERIFKFTQVPIGLINPLCWENWLRSSRPQGGYALAKIFNVSGHQTFLNLVRLSFFPAVAIVSIYIGFYRVSNHPEYSKYLSFDYNLNPLWVGFYVYVILVSISVFFGLLIGWKLAANTKSILRINSFF